MKRVAKHRSLFSKAINLLPALVRGGGRIIVVDLVKAVRKFDRVSLKSQTRETILRKTDEKWAPSERLLSASKYAEHFSILRKRYGELRKETGERRKERRFAVSR